MLRSYFVSDVSGKRFSETPVNTVNLRRPTSYQNEDFNRTAAEASTVA
jgi:hypothetical protein